MEWSPKRRSSRRAQNRKGDARYELPRTTLHGGDPLRGGHPCALGHAGRASLSFLQHSHNAICARAHVMHRAAQAFAAALLLMLAQTLAPSACNPTTAFATSGTDPKTVTLSTEYRHQLDGQEAYCTVISVSPPPKGTVVSSWTSGPLLLDYVLYHSEGGYDKQYGWEPARYAVWAIMHNDKRYLTTYGSGEAMPEWFSSQVKALYRSAEAWVAAGADGPERGCSRVYAPASNEYQPLAICVPQLGDISLRKASALPDITSGDACYSLSGAEYTLYSDAACTSPVAVMTTDEDAAAVASSLGQGTYYARETKAPMGFALSDRTYEVEVLPLKTVAIADGDVYDQPLFTDVGLLLRKGDSELTLLGNDSQAQGDGTLAGAQFILSRYANTKGDASASATRSWTIETDASGIATLDDAHFIAGDEPYRDSDGAVVLPLGTYTIEEIGAPEGYRTGEQSCCFVIEQQGSQAVTRIVSGATNPSSQPGSTQFLVTNDVIRGGVRLGKVDAQRLDHIAQGGATLEGAVLAIELASEQPVVVDGNTYAQGSVVATLLTGADGCAETAPDALPYGTYVAYEIEAPKGYRLTSREQWSQSFQIRDDGVVVDLSDESNSVPDQVKRGDLSFVKVDGHSMRRMAGVPFAIESLTTGERHVIVTDENGQCSTSAEFNAHTHLTNANDGLDGSDQPLEAQSDVADEVNFAEGTSQQEESSSEDDGSEETQVLSGVIEEAIADVAEALEAESEAAVQEDEGLASFGEPVPDSPEAVLDDPATQEEELVPGESAPEELLRAQEATLFAASFTEDAYDTSAGIWFSGGRDRSVPPDDSMGALPYDTYRVSELRCASNEGYDLISFEIRVSRDNVEIDGGTVDDHALPTLQTELGIASSSDDGDTWQLVDTVYFNNLTADGTEYELRGALHYVAEDGSDGGFVTNEAGNEVAATVTFKPNAPSGSVDITFTLDADLWRGRTVVAFEELWLDGQLIAEHSDISDSDQSITIPRIATTLTDAEGTSEVLGVSQAELIDTVTYEGLPPGKTYQLTGTLMDKATGEAARLSDGSSITSQCSLTPDAPSGTATVTFVFDGSLLLGHTVVAFESLSQEGVELAVHADLMDEAQSVVIPGIQTAATNGLDGGHLLLASRDATIVDTVSYQGLIPNSEYVLSGALVCRTTGEAVLMHGEPVQSETSFTPTAADGSVEMTFAFDATELAGTEVTVFERLFHDGKLVALHEDPSSDAQSLSIPRIATLATSETGSKTIDAASEQRIIDTVFYEGLEQGSDYLISGVIHLRDEKGNDVGPLTDASGKPIASSAPLVPEASSGEASIGFDIDASDLDKYDLVVFELLMDANTDVVVATHEDISDGDQSVDVLKPTTPPSSPTEPPAKRVREAPLPKMSDVPLPVRSYLAAGGLALGLGIVLHVRDRRRRYRNSQSPMQ